MSIAFGERSSSWRWEISSSEFLGDEVSIRMFLSSSWIRYM